MRARLSRRVQDPGYLPGEKMFIVTDTHVLVDRIGISPLRLERFIDGDCSQINRHEHTALEMFARGELN